MIFQKLLTGMGNAFKKESGFGPFRGKSKPAKTDQASKGMGSAKPGAKSTNVAVFDGQKQSEKTAKVVAESGDHHAEQTDKRRTESTKRFDNEVAFMEREGVRGEVAAAQARHGASAFAAREASRGSAAQSVASSNAVSYGQREDSRASISAGHASRSAQLAPSAASMEKGKSVSSALAARSTSSHTLTAAASHHKK